MIIRCHHLREAGIMDECCSHCHLLAGCCFQPLPHDHKAILCCGHAASLTQEEIETILSKISPWEAQEKVLAVQTAPEFPTRLRPPIQELESSSNANADGVAQHSPFTASSSSKTKERVGERRPTRDSVGEAPQQEKSTKCSFSEAIEVRVSEMTQEDIHKAECPVCGATRTVRIQGSNVLFPPHPPHLTRTSRNEDRWIKEGTTWTLFQRKG